MQVYQFLTSWVGDAYLQYTSDKLLLFTMGITLNVRPDCQRWRPFAILSGGQQALAALALSFAFQSAFPCPFYFFDEVLAQLIRAFAISI
jgi:chromosome segregation ATPase